MILSSTFTAGPLVDLEIAFQPFTVIVGPNGCGKTAVLAALFQRFAWRAQLVPSSHAPPVVDAAAGDAALEDLLRIFPAARTSAGALGPGPTRALGILAAAHRADVDLLLVDALEAGLHMVAQGDLVKVLRDVQRRRAAAGSPLQIICSTHSVFVADECEFKEVVVMALDKDGRGHARPLTACPRFEKNSRGFRAGELWSCMGEGWVVENNRDREG